MGRSRKRDRERPGVEGIETYVPLHDDIAIRRVQRDRERPGVEGIETSPVVDPFRVAPVRVRDRERPGVEGIETCKASAAQRSHACITVTERDPV